MGKTRRVFLAAIMATAALSATQAASADSDQRAVLGFSIRFTGLVPGPTTQVTGEGEFSVSGAIADRGTTAVTLTVTPIGPESQGWAFEDGEQTFTTAAGSFKAHFHGRVEGAATAHPYGEGRVEFTGLTGSYRDLSGTGMFLVAVDFTLPSMGGASGTYDGDIKVH